MDTSRARILRVAIVSGNTIVEERLLRTRDPVTIGPSPRDTLVVAASPELPRSFTLFAPIEAGWELRATRAMSGRIALDDKMEPVALDDLSPAARSDGIRRVQLGQSGRGRIVIGDLTLLYQFVEPPPSLPRPRLPPSLRGSIFQNLDGLMIALVATSFLAHTALVAWVRTIDLPRTPDIERLPDRRVTEFLVPRAVAEKQKPAVEAPRVDPNAHRPAVSRSVAHRNPPPSATAKRALLSAQLARTGLLNVIGSLGPDGVIADLIRPDPGSDADRVFRDVSGVRVGDAGPSLRSLREGFIPANTVGNNLRAINPDEVDSGHIDEHLAPKGEWIPRGPIDVPDPELVPLITAEVKKRKRAISACYERAIRGHEKLAGKLQIHFRLSVLGKVVSTEIDDDTVGDEGMRRCLVTAVSGWRFPPLKSEMEFSYPFIFQPIN